MMSVVVPIGPNPVYRNYLFECLDSIAAQTFKPSEVNNRSYPPDKGLADYTGNIMRDIGQLG